MMQVIQSFQDVVHVVLAKVADWVAFCYQCTHTLNTVPNGCQPKFDVARRGDHRAWHSTASPVEHTVRCILHAPREQHHLVIWLWSHGDGCKEHWPGVLQRIKVCVRGPQPGEEDSAELAASGDEHKWPNIPAAARAEDNDAAV